MNLISQIQAPAPVLRRRALFSSAREPGQERSRYFSISRLSPGNLGNLLSFDRELYRFDPVAQFFQPFDCEVQVIDLYDRGV
jgi:hypothetical protein